MQQLNDNLESPPRVERGTRWRRQQAELRLVGVGSVCKYRGRLKRLRRASVYAGFTLLAVLADAPRSLGQVAELVGRASCGSATCHGGVAPEAPAWNRSLRVWEATDIKHARAGRVLLSEPALKMVASLDGLTIDELGRQPHRLFASLQTRCVSCHAPQAAVAQATATAESKLEEDVEAKLRGGVDCEACHGAASQWLARHTLVDWKVDSPEATSAGAVPMRRWTVRTQTCLQCHVGSLGTDQPARDVNHELIAAGHPRLRFSMSQHQTRLPAHWELAESQGGAASAIAAAPLAQRSATTQEQVPVMAEVPTLAQHRQAAWLTVAAVAQLAQVRAEGASHGQPPQFDWAEFNCGDCHHALGSGAALPSSATAQRPLWGSWYTGGGDLDWPDLGWKPHRLHVRSESLSADLASLAEFARQSAEQSQTLPTIDAHEHLAWLLQRSESPWLAWEQAAAWLWQCRLTVLVLQRQAAEAEDATRWQALSERLQACQAEVVAEETGTTRSASTATRWLDLHAFQQHCRREVGVALASAVGPSSKGVRP